MSKKPLVPVKRPTKAKGRGKGNCREIKKLMKEVDSIAKGLKEVKGFKGGWNPFKKGSNKDVKEVVAENYYDKLRVFFENQENIANIKRLKEGLVNDVLGTMAGWFISILTTDVISLDAKKVAEIVNFVSIISDINNLKQGRLDEVINSRNLKELPYINKISTLVMIKMLIDVYKSQNNNKIDVNSISFNIDDELNNLIKKIIDEFKGNKDKDVLKNLTAEVINFKNRKDDIDVISQYYNSKDDGNAAKVLDTVRRLKARRDVVLQRIKEFNEYIKSSKEKLQVSKTVYIDSYKTSDINTKLADYNFTIKALTNNDIENKIKEIESDVKKGQQTTSMYNLDLYETIEKIKGIKKLLNNTPSADIKYDSKKWYDLYKSISKNENYIDDLHKKIEKVKGREAYLKSIIDAFVKRSPIIQKNIIGFTNENIEKKIVELNTDIEEYNISIDTKDPILDTPNNVDSIIELMNNLNILNKTINKKIRDLLEIIKSRYREVIDIYIDYITRRGEEIGETYVFDVLLNEVDSLEFNGLIEFNNKFKKAEEIFMTYLPDDISLTTTTDVIVGIVKRKIGEIDNSNDNILKDVKKTLAIAENKKPNKETENLKKFAKKLTAPTPPTFRNIPNLIEEDNGKTLDDYHRYRTTANELGGGKLTTKYISTGNFVYILYEKKKIKRCIYAKAKGRGKYCKIKGDYMLLSKLKVV